MSIDPNALGVTSGPKRRKWSNRDTLLYALGVGAGASERDLAFVTENSHNTPQQVLPTYAVILAEGNSVIAKAGKINFGKMLHGSQGFRVYRPIEPAGEADITTTITDLQDKGEGKNAIMTITAEARSVEDGGLIADSKTTLVFRGAGGFGGEAGSSPAKVEIPERGADACITYPVREDQALIYRLSGDRNPLHSDPWFAVERAGFPRTILHGLCTFGFAGRALLEALCDNQADRLISMDARFAAPVFPGESLTTAVWKTEDGKAVFTVSASGTDEHPERVVLDSGEAEYC